MLPAWTVDVWVLIVTPVNNATALCVMVISAVAVSIVPLRVAVTVNAANPLLDPARKVVEEPVEGVIEPRVLFSAQSYVIPEGHGLDEHVAVALKANGFPTWTKPDAGLTATEVKLEGGPVTMIVADMLCMPNPSMGRNVPAVAP